MSVFHAIDSFAPAGSAADAKDSVTFEDFSDRCQDMVPLALLVVVVDPVPVTTGQDHDTVRKVTKVRAHVLCLHVQRFRFVEDLLSGHC